jgi:dTDP-4-dehydrorhamnose 3,5-epimerase-like enzyme
MEPTIIEQASVADDRGFVVRPFEGKQLNDVCNTHLVSLNPGAVRGNHFHPAQTEYIFFLGDKCKLVTVDSVTGERTEKIIDGKKCPLIIVPQKIAHAIKNISAEIIYLLCYTDKPLIPERDVIKKVILE